VLGLGFYATFFSSSFFFFFSPAFPSSQFPFDFFFSLLGAFNAQQRGKSESTACTSTLSPSPLPPSLPPSLPPRPLLLLLGLSVHGNGPNPPPPPPPAFPQAEPHRPLHRPRHHLKRGDDELPGRRRLLGKPRQCPSHVYLVRLAPGASYPSLLLPLFLAAALRRGVQRSPFPSIWAEPQDRTMARL
jgi:hypothetical protein